MATVAIWLLFWCIGIIKVHMTNFQRLSEKKLHEEPSLWCQLMQSSKWWGQKQTLRSIFCLLTAVSLLYALDLQQNLELDNSRSFFLVVKLHWRTSHSRFVDCKDLCFFQGAYLDWNRQVQFSDSFRYLWKAAAVVVMVLQPIWCILGCREWGWIFAWFDHTMNNNNKQQKFKQHHLCCK